MLITTDISPRVSVLMPVYNTREDHLRSAIESILTQSYADFEFLIVNDASTDPNVERVVKTYGDPRIRYYANAENMGISDVRNKLISLSRGVYLAVMDHDDISLSERFAKEVAYLDAHPDVGVLGCQFERFGDDNMHSIYPTEDADIRVALLGSCVIQHPTSMIRKSVLEMTGLRYEREYSPAEDYALFCKLMNHTKFHNLPEVLFRYRWHATNTSRIQHAKIAAATGAVIDMVREKNPDIFEKLHRNGRQTMRVKLFGFLPILKIVSERKFVKAYLFNRIPVYKIVISGPMHRHFLFTMIPWLTVKKEIYVKDWITG